MLGVAVALLEAVGLLLLVPLLSLVGVDVGDGPVAGMARAVGTAFGAAGIQVNLGSVLAVYVGIVSLQAAVMWAEGVSSVRVREHTAMRLRELLYGALVRMRWRELARDPSSHYVHLLTSQLDRAGQAVTYGLALIPQLLVSVVYVGLAMRVAPALSLVAIASGVTLLLLARRFTAQLRDSGEDLNAAVRRLHTTVIEHLANMKVAKSFAVEDRHVAHFGVASESVAASGRRTGVAFAGARATLAVGSAVLLAALVYAGITVFELASAALLLLLYIFARLVPRFSSIQHVINQIVHSAPSLRATMADLVRFEHAAEIRTGTDGPSFELRREIRFQGVSFAYDSGSPVVSDVSFTVPVGGITALIGRSGAGKSTIADMILGLLEPSAGEVRIDDTGLTPRMMQLWRASIAYVPQEPVLYNDTILNNLLWAVPEAGEADVRAALEAAGAGFVFELRDGVHSLAGERGGFLSGGERQRIALARALLRRPRLLVLDEPTSSLDAENEQRILAVLRALRGETTLFLISHRFSTAQIADHVIVLDRGKVVDSGTWHHVGARSTRIRQLLDAEPGVAGV